MAKKVSGTDKAVVHSIEGAVAAYIIARDTPCTTKQCMQELLQAVRVLVNNAKLTVQNIKQSLKNWLREGWAIISKDTLQITRSGRVKIKEIAELATAPSPAT